MERAPLVVNHAFASGAISIHGSSGINDKRTLQASAGCPGTFPDIAGQSAYIRGWPVTHSKHQPKNSVGTEP